MIGTTQVHEFNIFYNHIELNILSWLCDDSVQF